jgi:hypothetical protein
VSRRPTAFNVRSARAGSHWCGGVPDPAWAAHGGILPNARKVKKEGDTGSGMTGLQPSGAGVFAFFLKAEGRTAEMAYIQFESAHRGPNHYHSTPFSGVVLCWLPRRYAPPEARLAVSRNYEMTTVHLCPPKKPASTWCSGPSASRQSFGRNLSQQGLLLLQPPAVLGR